MIDGPGTSTVRDVRRALAIDVRAGPGGRGPRHFDPPRYFRFQ